MEKVKAMSFADENAVVVVTDIRDKSLPVVEDRDAVDPVCVQR